MAIGARIVLRDGRGLRCVLWYVCAHSYKLYSRRRGREGERVSQRRIGIGRWWMDG